jgi:hypothetical protein
MASTSFGAEPGTPRKRPPVTARTLILMVQTRPRSPLAPGSRGPRAAPLGRSVPPAMNTASAP